MGMRFASGNVFYMNRVYVTKHLNSVGSPLSMGYITQIRSHSVSQPSGGSMVGWPSGLAGDATAMSDLMTLKDALADIVGCGSLLRTGVYLNPTCATVNTMWATGRSLTVVLREEVATPIH